MGSPQYGLCVLNFGESSYARNLAELTYDAEKAGCDGFFLSDTIVFHKSGKGPLVDYFTALAAISMSTSQIRIGTTVAALPRRSPWLVAREAVSIDHLSGGRLTLGVGLGDPPDVEFQRLEKSATTRYVERGLTKRLTLFLVFGVARNSAITASTSAYKEPRSCHLQDKSLESRYG